MSDVDLDVGRDLPSGRQEGVNPLGEGLREGEEPLTPVIEDVIPDEQTRIEIQNYLQQELEDVIDGNDRTKLKQRWDKWRRQRNAEPERETKNTPWPNASNMAVPVAATNTNGIYAHLKMSFVKQKPFFTVKATKKRWQENAKAIQKLMNILVESPTHMNLRKKNNILLYDAVSMGTQFVEIPWQVDRWHFTRSGDIGEGYEEVEKTVYDGPAINAPQLEYTLTRAEWSDPQTAPWFAFWHRLTWGQIKQNEALGMFTDVDQIKEHEAQEAEENTQEQRERLGVDPDPTDNQNPFYDIMKVYLLWDVDGDDYEEDVILWVERDSLTILSAEFNETGRRPIVRVPFWEMPGQLYAIGVGQMCERLQQEIDDLHNMRNNSIHLSSLQMLAVRKGALPQGIKFKPLQQLPMDSPKEDALPFSFPDVSGSTFTAEQIAKTYADNFTGATAPQMGQPDTVAKSGTSATLQAFLAQQGNIIQNAVVESIRDAYSEIGLVTLMQLVANKERVLADGGLIELLDDTEREQVEAVLTEIEVEDIPLAFNFQVFATDVDETEDAKRQQLLTLNQLYSMYFQEMMQVMQVMNNPQAPQQVRQFATQYYVGRTKLMEQTFELLNQHDTEDMLPYTKNTELMLDMLKTMQEQQTNVMRDQFNAMGVPIGTGEPTANPAGFPANAGGGPSVRGPEAEPGVAGAEQEADGAAPAGNRAPEEGGGGGGPL